MSRTHNAESTNEKLCLLAATPWRSEGSVRLAAQVQARTQQLTAWEGQSENLLVRTHGLNLAAAATGWQLPSVQSAAVNGLMAIGERPERTRTGFLRRAADTTCYPPKHPGHFSRGFRNATQHGDLEDNALCPPVL